MMDPGPRDVPRASLDLTHVLYDDASLFSTFLALLTLSPILLMASYAALAVYTRELTIIFMWAGQFACEAFNWLLKRAIRQERPAYSVGNGYGFPSSHSQYMGYFATFLLLHLTLRHRSSSCGFPFLDLLARAALYTGIVLWAGTVCYSRYHLTYHSQAQILWGLFIGVLFGALFHTLTETLPLAYPNSLLGIVRTQLLTNPICAFFRIRDGWMVWPDGGLEEEWRVWKDGADKVIRSKATAKPKGKAASKRTD